MADDPSPPTSRLPRTRRAAMPIAVTIAAKDLRQKVRDRSAILLSVVAPFLLAALFATILGGNDSPFHATWAYADLDSGPLAAAMRTGPLQALESAGIVEVVPVTSAEEAERAVADGGVTAAIVVPAGFSTGITNGGGGTLRVIATPDAVLSGQLARSIADGFAQRVQATRLSVAAALTATGRLPDATLTAALAERADALPDPILLATAVAADRQASMKTYFAASMAVLFVFFAAQFGVMGLLAERRTGTLARILASPIAARTVLLGKVLVSLTLAIVSMSVIWLGTSLLLGARWGEPVAVAALILGTAVSASGIALLVVGFARTEDQAGGAIAIVAMTLAILGGAFFPMSQAPEGLARLSLLTPQAWFLQGIDDLAGGGGVGAVLVPVAVLLAIGLVTGSLGLARARRVVAG